MEELDGEHWDEPEFNSSVVVHSHRLRRVPLKNFTIEDLRLMIGQEIGLEYLIPLALEHLERNPFVGGDYYPGDLLKNVLGIKHGFWRQHPALRQQVNTVVEKACSTLDRIEDDEIAESIRESLNGFE